MKILAMSLLTIVSTMALAGGRVCGEMQSKDVGPECHEGEHCSAMMTHEFFIGDVQVFEGGDGILNDFYKYDGQQVCALGKMTQQGLIVEEINPN